MTTTTKAVGRTRTSTVVLTVLALLAAFVSPASALPSDVPDGSDDTNGDVYAIAYSGSTIFIAGSFSEVGGQPRNNLAAIDAATGQVTGWDPNVNRSVHALDVAPDGTLYIVGKFSRVDGKKRVKVAAFDPSGQLSSFTAKAKGGRVQAVRATNSEVYIGGRFSEVNGQARAGLAALDPSGNLLPWDPAPDLQVWDVEIESDGDVWVAGKFNQIGGRNVKGIAELDAVTGLAKAFTPEIKVLVYDIELDSQRVYAAAGGPGGRVIAYALDIDTGSLMWSAKANGDFQAIAVSPFAVYAGGHHDLLEGVPNSQMAAFDRDTGEVLDWNAGTTGNKGVWSIVVSPEGLLVGGEFNRASGVQKGGFARFPGTA